MAIEVLPLVLAPTLSAFDVISGGRWHTFASRVLELDRLLFRLVVASDEYTPLRTRDVNRWLEKRRRVAKVRQPRMRGPPESPTRLSDEVVEDRVGRLPGESNSDDGENGLQPAKRRRRRRGRFYSAVDDTKLTREAAAEATASIPHATEELDEKSSRHHVHYSTSQNVRHEHPASSHDTYKLDDHAGNERHAVSGVMRSHSRAFTDRRTLADEGPAPSMPSESASERRNHRCCCVTVVVSQLCSWIWHTLCLAERVH
jgi:hypothetical protein